MGAEGMGADGALDTHGNVEEKKADPLVGQTIDRYHIVAKLGEGGMGAVYKAQHVTLKRYSALKVLPADQVKTMPDAVQGFIREARAAAALTHPKIVAIYAVGETDELEDGRLPRSPRPNEAVEVGGEFDLRSVRQATGDRDHRSR